MKTYLVIFFFALVGCVSSQSPTSKYESKPSDPESGLVEMDMKNKEAHLQAPLPPVNALPEVVSNPDRLRDQLLEAIQKQDERKIAIASRELLIRNPQDLSALNALALFYFRKGEAEMSKTLLNKAISIDPNVSLLYSNLGFILQSQNHFSDATVAYRQALKVDPFNPLAAANLGFLYAQKKDYRKAHVALEIAVEKGQRDWKTLTNYGVSLMGAGKFQAAEGPLKRSTELQPQNAEVLFNYAILLIDHLSKPNEGLDVINRIRFIGPGPDLRKKISELENRAKSVLK